MDSADQRLDEIDDRVVELFGRVRDGLAAATAAFSPPMARRRASWWRTTS